MKSMALPTFLLLVLASPVWANRRVSLKPKPAPGAAKMVSSLHVQGPGDFGGTDGMDMGTACVKSICDGVDKSQMCNWGACQDCPECKKTASTVTTTTTPTLVEVKVHSCDLGWSGSNGGLTAQLSGSAAWAGIATPIAVPGRNKWATYKLPGGSTEPTTLHIKALTSDGWCVDQIEVEGKPVCAGFFPQWLDKPCEAPASYHGDPCGTEYTWSLDAPCATTTQPPPPVVNVELETCDYGYAGTNGGIDIRFPPDTDWTELNNPGNDRERGATDKYQVTLKPGSPMPTSVTLKARSSDGWCIAKIKVEDQEVCEQLPHWLDKPCADNYHGVPCTSFHTWPLIAGPCVTTTTPPPPTMKIRAHTCDAGYAGSNSGIDVEFPQAIAWTEINNPGDDRRRNRWDEYELDLAPGTVAPTTMSIRIRGNDGWCVDKIEVNGKPICANQLPLWIDGDCPNPPEYHGVTCVQQQLFNLC